MRLKNTSLDKLMSDQRVESVDSSGGEQRLTTVTLKRGFIDSESSSHVMLCSPSAALRRMKQVESCACWQCKGN